MAEQRQIISTPEQLVSWRLAHGLSQEKAAPIFRRCRRMMQYLEAGKHLGIIGGKKKLPPDIDDLAMLYDLVHKNKRKKNAIGTKKRA